MKPCTPLRFVRESATIRGRIGGRGPVGIVPRTITDDTAYFATVPLSGKLDVSVFISATWDTNPKTSIWQWSQQILDNDTRIIEAVPHVPIRRALRTRFWELLAPLSLEEGSEQMDSDPNWEGCAYLGHKFGGQAGFKPGNQHLDLAVEALTDDGFFQVAQLAFPSDTDESIDGSWPFGEMTFHFFGRLSPEPQFRFLWAK